MNECIAMAAGFILGAACVICAIVALFSMQDEDKNFEEEEVGRIPSVEDEKLKKQWENFLNYNGTSDAQMSIGDE